MQAIDLWVTVALAKLRGFVEGDSVTQGGEVAGSFAMWFCSWVEQNVGGAREFLSFALGAGTIRFRKWQIRKRLQPASFATRAVAASKTGDTSCVSREIVQIVIEFCYVLLAYCYGFALRAQCSPRGRSETLPHVKAKGADERVATLRGCSWWRVRVFKERGLVRYICILIVAAFVKGWNWARW